MSKKQKGSKTNWKRMTPSIPAGEWLKALGIAAAMGLLACAAAFLLPSETDDAQLPVVINRVMTSNPAACFSVDGEYYDWIELENIGDSPVNLKGWKITDKADIRSAYEFEGCMLAPGDSKLIYCAETPEGYSGDEVFTGFALSNNGELLLLSDPRQHISALEVPALGKKDVFQRDPATGRYSGIPFYELLGTEADYAEDLTPPYAADSVQISEVMPANRTVLMDEDGDFSDWIELYNGTAAPVDLADWALSDDDVNHRKWVLPSRTLQSGEYLIVFASGKDRKDGSELHANFRLSSEGEAVRLYDPQGVVSSWVEYQGASADKSLSRESDGSLSASMDPSPGYANTDAGARQAASAMLTNARGLYINEIVSSAKGPDWVEIHNAGTESVDLTGMGLSDNPAKPRKWQFPSGAKLGPDGYLVVTLTGATPEDDTDNKQASFTPDYDAPFALSGDETVCLATAEGALLDRVKLYDQARDVSYGRAEGHNGFRYFSDLTPGKPNAEKSYAGVTKEIQFSLPRGMVNEKSPTLDLTSTPGAKIYYTADGSAPKPSSSVWAGPTTLKSFTFIRAVAVAEDCIPSPEATGTFIPGQHTLRLVSITGKHSQLDGSGGVLNTGARTECTVRVEMYEPDGTQLISQNCILRTIGHHSRVNYKQKSFKLTAKRATGDTRFRAKLFSNRDYDEVKAVVMRASGQDVEQTKMRDSILTALAADTSVMYQETELCVVYVNGKYWGEYNMREHIDEHSIAQFEGWEDPDGVQIGEGTGKSVSDYSSMIHWADSHNLAKDENVEKLREMMDIDNYLDYVILQMYTNNQDLNNVKFYNSPKEDPRWKWVLFDLDLSYQLDFNNVRSWLGHEVGSITTQTTTPFRQLMENDKVKDQFLTRFGELLATTLSSENVVSKITERATLLQPEMARNCKRWGWKTATWERYVKDIISYARKRPAKVIDDLCKTFHLSDAQRQMYFGDALAKIG